jgi:hypothetical protein
MKTLLKILFTLLASLPLPFDPLLLTDIISETVRKLYFVQYTATCPFVRIGIVGSRPAQLEVSGAQTVR